MSITTYSNARDLIALLQQQDNRSAGACHLRGASVKLEPIRSKVCWELSATVCVPRRCDNDVVHIGSA